MALSLPAAQRAHASGSDRTMAHAAERGDMVPEGGDTEVSAVQRWIQEALGELTRERRKGKRHAFWFTAGHSR